VASLPPTEWGFVNLAVPTGSGAFAFLVLAAASSLNDLACAQNISLAASFNSYPTHLDIPPTNNTSNDTAIGTYDDLIYYLIGSTLFQPGIFRVGFYNPSPTSCSLNVSIRAEGMHNTSPHHLTPSPSPSYCFSPSHSYNSLTTPPSNDVANNFSH